MSGQPEDEDKALVDRLHNHHYAKAYEDALGKGGNRHDAEVYALEYARGAMAGRARCMTILHHPEARNRRELAYHLALNTDISAEDAVASLKASVKRAEIPPRALRTDDIAGRLAMLDRLPEKEEPKGATLNRQDLYAKFTGKAPEPPK